MEWVEISPDMYLEDGALYRVRGSVVGMTVMAPGKLREFTRAFDVVEATIMAPIAPRYRIVAAEADGSAWMVTVRYTADPRTWAEKMPPALDLPTGVNGGSLFGVLLAAGTEARIWVQCDTLETPPLGAETDAAGGLAGKVLWIPAAAIGGYLVLKWWKGK